VLVACATAVIKKIVYKLKRLTKRYLSRCKYREGNVIGKILSDSMLQQRKIDSKASRRAMRCAHMEFA
jgi:hypothetical protein